MKDRLEEMKERMKVIMKAKKKESNISVWPHYNTSCVRVINP